MSDISKDAWLNERTRHQGEGRTFVSDDHLRWGELILPADGENSGKTEDGLRVLVIASMPIGYPVLQTLNAYERHYPDRLNLVGLLTDDPLNHDARISARKRIWHLYPLEQRTQLEFATVESGLESGIQVFTGDVKNDWFRARLRSWAPDAVICCGYGQILDGPFLAVPPMGVCNLHPADLRGGRGAGPAPYDDAAERQAETTCFTVHLMTEEIDAGPVIGVSPPINIRTETLAFPSDPAVYYTKMLDGLDHLTFHLAESLIGAAAAGRLEPLGQVDFAAMFSPAKQAEMMQPIRGNTRFKLAEPDPALFAD
jgi:hypothetical protein